MPAAKAKKDASGLGNAIRKRRIEDRKRQHQSLLHTTELPSGLASITQENDLETFLNTAQLADKDFTAERRNITVLAPSAASEPNAYLLSAEEERKVKAKQSANRDRLRVPRRPDWTRETGKEELERRERDSFLEWRRGLAELAERDGLLMTPFERNLSVWRQLWRTIERSHVIVQIVDARNPLGFRCVDLETYVMESKPKGTRRNLLLVNKADLLTPRQREIWAAYFAEKGIAFAFFSALDAITIQEQELRAEGLPIPERIVERDGDEEGTGSSADEESEDEDEVESGEESTEDEEAAEEPVAGPSSPRPTPARSSVSLTERDPAAILDITELEALLYASAPDLVPFQLEGKPPVKLTIGLCGYPNVGKSSSINALVGAKKVSVSSTPGHTKNFQTIHLSDDLVLCDCPGLVFPQFATTQAELVVDGVLPIDQIREHTGPVALVAHRIPKPVLEATYGLQIDTLPIEEGGTGIPSASEFLSCYSVARGFFTQGVGNPDEARSARYVLKDYVSGKLLYARPPPGTDEADFNAENRDLHRLRLLDRVRSKRAPTTRVGQSSDTFIAHAKPNATDGTAAATTTTTDGSHARQSHRASVLESDFFDDVASSLPRVRQSSARTARHELFSRNVMIGNDGRPVTDVDFDDAASTVTSLGGIGPAGGKRHFKGGRKKQRSGGLYT